MATRESLDEGGKALWDQLGPSRRGQIGGPFLVWLRIPDIAAAADVFGATLRVHGTLPRHLFELITLVCARRWEAPYPWSVHVDAAVEAGLGASGLAAVCDGLPAETVDDEDERLVLTLVRAILETGHVDEASFNDGNRRFGDEGMIELVTTVGFYTTAAFVANAFQVEVKTPAHQRCGRTGADFRRPVR